jgi:hypothetical protein
MDEKTGKNLVEDLIKGKITLPQNPFISRERTEKLFEILKNYTPCDTTSISGTRDNQPQKTTYFLIPSHIGIKENEITLVWTKYGIKTTTKAVRNELDKHDFELGFLIAYYKKVHENWQPSTLRDKIVELFTHFDGHEEDLKKYLRVVYTDNCLLDYQNAQRFLKYINKRATDNTTIVVPQNFITREEKGETTNE